MKATVVRQGILTGDRATHELMKFRVVFYPDTQESDGQLCAEQRDGPDAMGVPRWQLAEEHVKPRVLEQAMLGLLGRYRPGLWR